jgi:hypothetical protein
MSVIPALGKLREKDHRCKTSLRYIARPCRRTMKEGGKEEGREKRKRSEEGEEIIPLFFLNKPIFLNGWIHLGFFGFFFSNSPEVFSLFKTHLEQIFI